MTQEKEIPIQKLSGKNQIEKMISFTEETKKLKSLVETHASNGIAKPISLLFEKPPDDTLSRLENLANLPKPEYREEFVGGIYPLNENDEFLIVLLGLPGKLLVMRIAPPPNSSEKFLKRYRQQLNQPSFSIKIKGDDEIENFYQNPLSFLFYPYYEVYNEDGPKTIVYRSDQIPNEEVKKRVAEDFEQAIRYSTETLAQKREENWFAVMEALLEGAKRAENPNPPSADKPSQPT